MDRILTTHAGSLIRPPELVAMMRAKDEGVAVDQRAWETTLDRLVAEQVRRQAEIGIDILTDGELRKEEGFAAYIFSRLSGFTHKPGPGRAGGSLIRANQETRRDRREFADFYKEYDGIQRHRPGTLWERSGPIAYSGQAKLAHEIAALEDAVRGVKAEGVFMTAIAPANVAPYVAGSGKDEVEELFQVAEALRVEYRAIVDAGFILQIDDPRIVSGYETMVPPGTLADYRKWMQVRVEALNHALDGIPEDRTRYHICWGSWNGPHAFDFEIKDGIDILLGVRCAGYSIEMANPRHEHEWRVWETVALPDGKYLIPGVIAHTTNVVEHPDLVAERIVRLARLVGRERVMAGTDCGFAQGPYTQRVHPSIQWAKLASLVEGARRATLELWPARRAA